MGRVAEQAEQAPGRMSVGVEMEGEWRGGMGEGGGGSLYGKRASLCIGVDDEHISPFISSIRRCQKNGPRVLPSTHEPGAMQYVPSHVALQNTRGM